MKKLDKLIIKAFVGPFFATFFVTLIVLVMQFFWLWIDDFAGKGLSTGIILEFIWYQSAVLIPLALPLSVLLSSLLTFGNLGENYELVAIKSAGVSLLRFMRPLFFITVIICGVAFLFSNYIIPVANLKSRTLLADIVYAKPAFDIKEGVFYYKINGFAIKIGKKENDTIIRNIIIYEQSGGLQDNFIIATDGVMRVSKNKKYLEFNLKNGWRYQERGNYQTPNTEFIRIGFKEFKKVFDLSAFQFQRTADSANRGNWRMLSMRQLGKAIDSMKKQNKQFAERIKSEVFTSVQIAGYLDSSSHIEKVKIPSQKLREIVPDSLKTIIKMKLGSKINAMRSANESLLLQYQDEQKALRRHQIEWHRKLSLSFACLVLFMIGAPLGAIIRKGGLGNSIIASIVFFMLFYFLGTTGEKFAKEGAWGVVTGMWFSTFVLVPIGIFLTYKAMHDSQLFNREFYFRLWRQVKVVGQKKMQKRNPA
ncbi:MAG: LptF/LptG family permease [Chitinophagaceae bacterium]|nr:LptF/LptG family permease [Chitinophagaceae bacterium]